MHVPLRAPLRCCPLQPCLHSMCLLTPLLKAPHNLSGGRRHCGGGAGGQRRFDVALYLGFAHVWLGLRLRAIRHWHVWGAAAARSQGLTPLELRVPWQVARPCRANMVESKEQSEARTLSRRCLEVIEGQNDSGFRACSDVPRPRFLRDQCTNPKHAEPETLPVVSIFFCLALRSCQVRLSTFLVVL